MYVYTLYVQANNLEDNTKMKLQVMSFNTITFQEIFLACRPQIKVETTSELKGVIKYIDMVNNRSHPLLSLPCPPKLLLPPPKVLAKAGNKYGPNARLKKIHPLTNESH